MTATRTAGARVNPRRDLRAVERIDNEDPGFAHFWHPVARSADIGESTLHAVQLLGERWVVGRIRGEIVVLADVCPHRLAPLSAGRVVDDAVECAYHGYRFGDDGACLGIPSLTGTTRVPARADVRVPAGVVERNGLVWIAPEAPLAPVVDIPEWDDPGWDCWWLEPITTTVSAATMTDNFLEAYHFTYLHLDTFGPGVWSVESCTRDGWRIQLKTTLGDGGAEGRQCYEVQAPFSVRDVTERDGGLSGTFVLTCQPVSSTETRIYFAQCYRDSHGDDEIRASRDAFSRAVMNQDLGILVQYPDPRLPADFRVELHTKEDAGGLEYRRVLAEARAPHPADDPLSFPNEPSATNGARNEQ